MWVIAKGDECIYMAADVDVILGADYKDTQNRPIRIGICVSGLAIFPTANPAQEIAILTALDTYLKDSIKQRFPFQSGEEVIEFFLNFIKQNYGSESFDYIAINNLFGVGVSIGDSLGIAGFDGEQIQQFSGYLEMAMLCEGATLNIDSRFGNMPISIKLPEEKFKHLASLKSSDAESLLPRSANILKKIIFAPAYGEEKSTNHQITVSEECDMISLSKQKGIDILQNAPESQPQQPKSSTASSVTFAPYASFHSALLRDDEQEQPKNNKRSHGGPKCRVC